MHNSRMHLGIDFGTTHTTAALSRAGQLQFVPLDRLNKDPHLLRSLLYITREHEVILGVRAAQTYLADNTGRMAQLEEKVVGTIENTVARTDRHPLDPDGPIVIVYDVIIEEDVGAPGRLLQSVKTGLRDPEYAGTRIYGRYYSLPHIISLILQHVKEQAETAAGARLPQVTLGRPVRFADDPAADALAESRLREAAHLAGFEQVTFAQEPVAAALFYTQHLQQAKTILVFDFGGGTLDLTVMQGERGSGHGRAARILATQGVLVGGDDLDSAIMSGRVASLFGTGSVIDREGHPFPAHLGEKLARWQTILELSKTEHIAFIRKARLNGNNPSAFAALECLARKNYGFPLFEQIEQTKRQLSATAEARLQMDAEEIHLDLPLTRRAFQGMIAAEIAQVQIGIEQVLQKAGVGPEAIEVVVTTGGSSLIPVFQNLLQRRFTGAEWVHSDTFGSVAAGLALAAARDGSGD